MKNWDFADPKCPECGEKKFEVLATSALLPGNEYIRVLECEKCLAQITETYVLSPTKSRLDVKEN